MTTEAVIEHTMLMGKLCALSEAVLKGMDEQEAVQGTSDDEAGQLMERANEALQEACDALQKLFSGDKSSIGTPGSSVDDPGFKRMFWKTFLPLFTAFNLLYGMSRSQEAR